MVVAVNVATYVLFLAGRTPRETLAWVIIGLAVPYAAWTLIARPYERYPLLRFGFGTLAVDAALITAWVAATGGPASEFWVIYFISVASVAMRYDLREAVLVAAAEALAYAAVMALDGGLTPAAMVVRPVYIVITGFAVGLLARQERISREDRVMYERLAEEHAEMLARERHTVEGLRELDRLKSEFITNASHELRTPLTTLIGGASTLARYRREMAPESIEMCLDAMLRQGDRARLLIENLLDLTSIERGVRPTAVGPVDVAQVVAGVMDMCPPPEGHDVQLDLQPGLSVMGEEVSLVQVLTNLLKNAYLYGGDRIRLTARGGPDGEVLLAVGDDGSGVPEEAVPRLFEAFHRGADVANVPGSGLGLAISRRLVEALGGDIWYEREEPTGSRFAVRLRAAA